MLKYFSITDKKKIKVVIIDISTIGITRSKV